MRGRASRRPISWALRFSAETVLSASTPPAIAALTLRRAPLPLRSGSVGMPSMARQAGRTPARRAVALRESMMGGQAMLNRLRRGWRLHGDASGRQQGVHQVPASRLLLPPRAPPRFNWALHDRPLPLVIDLPPAPHPASRNSLSTPSPPLARAATMLSTRQTAAFSAGAAPVRVRVARAAAAGSRARAVAVRSEIRCAPLAARRAAHHASLRRPPAAPPLQPPAPPGTAAAASKPLSWPHCQWASLAPPAAAAGPPHSPLAATR